MKYRYFTDYPFEFLGDYPGIASMMREVKVLAYDRDKYVTIKLGTGEVTEIKSDYLYMKPRNPHKYFSGFMEKI